MKTRQLIRMLAKTLQCFLFVFAFVFMEVQHAKECKSQASLWNGAVVLEDVLLWCNVWLSALVLRVILLCGLEVDHQRKRHQLWRSLSVDLRHEFVLCLFICVFRVFVATNVVPMCVYTLPICYQAWCVPQIILHFANMH